MGGTIKDIKLRIKSVEGTMQITKAMELVASSKLRRARARMERSRPYFETLYATLCDMAAADPELQSPYLSPKGEGKVCYIVIAGDRGLAGGYNANVARGRAPSRRRSPRSWRARRRKDFSQTILRAIKTRKRM